MAELLRPQAAQREKAGKRIEPWSNLDQGSQTGRTRKLAAANTGYSASTLDEVAMGTGRQRNELAGAEYSAPAVSHEEVRRESAGVANATPDGAALGVDKETIRRDAAGGAFAPPDGEMEATGEIPQSLARVTGLDGKSYPAKVTTTTRQTEATKVEHVTDAAARPGTTPYTRPCERV